MSEHKAPSLPGIFSRKGAVKLCFIPEKKADVPEKPPIKKYATDKQPLYF